MNAHAQGGPVAALLQACRTAQIDMPNASFLRTYNQEGEAKDMPLLTSERGKFEHFVREALRDEQYWRLDMRRAGFDQTRKGINRKATLDLQSKLPGLQKYQWRCVLSGAIGTMKRCHKKGRVDSPQCPACGEEEEDERHIFDVCRTYAP